MLERVKELDQDDEQYLAMLRQPVLVNSDYPRQVDEEVEKFILHIFQQPLEDAFRRSRIYYAQRNNDYLASAIQPNQQYKIKQWLKKKIKG